jgi:hypothetical protein
MNTTHLFAAAGLSLLLPCIVPLAAARADISVTDGLGTWEGSGVATDPGGTQTSPFTVTMVRKSIGNGVVRADGTIHMGDGKQIAFWEEHTDRAGGGCKVTSSMGTGGGRCFSNHMCQYYADRGDGHAFATTVSADGADKIRVLVTELEAGKAVRFYAQSLVKKP